jgi:glycosyltransferase involved in cell wall biosynthesis
VPHDRAAVRAAVRAELGLAPRTQLLAFFGFVHPVKGIRYLLPALARVRARRAGTHLLIVGGFESRALPGAEAAAWRDEIERLIATLGLGDAVTLTGWRPEEEVSRLLSAADVGVLPFTAGTTTRSGALLACAAHGLPLVVTESDPPDPALREGETALLVPPRDPAALAAALVRVLGNGALAGRLRAGGRDLAAAHDWGAIADRHLALYAEAEQSGGGWRTPGWAWPPRTLTGARP